MRACFTLMFFLFVVCSCGGDKSPDPVDTDPGTTDTEITSTVDTSPPSTEVSQPEVTTTDAQDVVVVAPVDLTPPDPGQPGDQNQSIDAPAPPDVPLDSGPEVSALPDLTTLSLNGSIPQSPLGPPVFNALNSDGAARTASNLMGTPTIMWFFPLAGTPG